MLILCYLSKFNILSHNSIPKWSDLKIPFTTRGHFFLIYHFEYEQLYVIFQIEHFVPYFSLSQYYLDYVYISHIFVLFKSNFDKIKLICVPIHYYWSIPFSAVSSVFFFTFFTCMWDICSWGTNYTFFATTTILGFYCLMSTKVRSILGDEGSTPDLGFSSRSIFQLYFLTGIRVHSGSGCSSPIYVSP